MKKIIYGINYMINHHIFKKRIPLICGLVVTNKCNLRCRHCRIYNRDTGDLEFDEVTAVLDSFYRKGGRSVYLEGGEPFLWHDREYGLEDIVDYAHRIGFLTVVIYTNGTIPIKSSADTVFVSIDGLQKTHDDLRGKTFDIIMRNVHESEHHSLYVNYTINSFSKRDIEEFCEYTNEINRIRGTFFYFHTPYYGRDELYIDAGERREILLKLIEYRKKYKILNSLAGLKSALNNDWERPLDICHVYEKGNTYKCCRFPGDPELCQDCGYLSYAEINETLKLKPSAIANALKYF
jgi:MoaA/NifB/PqqE/SkfB family radical SAM enzyme